MEETREKEEILDRAELERIDDEGIGSWDRHDPDGFAALSPTPSRWSDWNVPEPIRDEEAFGATSRPGSPRSRTSR